MPRTVVCYGDSNTHGAATVPRPNGRYGPEERWCGVLAARLGVQWRVIEEGLGGRTCVFDDPVEGEFRNGERYLLPCLLSHQPIDLVILMLGTNDLKARFRASAAAIAAGMAQLTRITQSAGVGPGGGPTRVLIVAPPPLLPQVSMHGELFAGGRDKSLALAAEYGEVARRLGAGFLDAGSVVGFSAVDGFHLDPAAHRRLGSAITETVCRMMQ